jgi:hypothetical protein
LLGQGKQKIKKDRICYCVGTDKKESYREIKCRGSEYVAPKLLITMALL